MSLVKFIYIPWKSFSKSKKYSLFKKHYIKTLKGKMSFLSFTRLQKYIALNSNITKKETSIKFLKKKLEKKYLKLKFNIGGTLSLVDFLVGK